MLFFPAENKLSMSETFKKIVKNDGVFGLYRGLVPNMLKLVPAVSIRCLMYEKIARMLGEKMS